MNFLKNRQDGDWSVIIITFRQVDFWNRGNSGDLPCSWKATLFNAGVYDVSERASYSFKDDFNKLHGNLITTGGGVLS